MEIDCSYLGNNSAPHCARFEVGVANQRKYLLKQFMQLHRAARCWLMISRTVPLAT